jgi:hypothetical protein
MANIFEHRPTGIGASRLIAPGFANRSKWMIELKHRCIEQTVVLLPHQFFFAYFTFKKQRPTFRISHRTMHKGYRGSSVDSRFDLSSTSSADTDTSLRTSPHLQEHEDDEHQK